MTPVMTATEARVHFGELLRRVCDGGQTIIVERAGRERVVVMTLSEYERLQDTARGDQRLNALARVAAVASAIGNRTRASDRPSPEDVVRAGREARDAAWSVEP